MESGCESVMADYCIPLHGGNVHRAARARRVDVEEFMDFSANINPFGPSPLATQAIGSNLHMIRHYPDPDCTDLREELAWYLQTDASSVIVGNGGAEIIQTLAYVLRPQKALILSPTFSEYGRAVANAGGTVVRVPLRRDDGYSIDYDMVRGNMDGVDMVWVCNPNNPTGTLVPRESIMELADLATRCGAALVVDEAFIDFVADSEKHSVRDEVRKRWNLVVTGSLTKFFAIPGLRVGYAIAHENLADRLRQQAPPWSVNSLAQVAAVASLRDTEYIASTQEFVARERAWFVRELAELGAEAGIEVIPPSANFILLDISKSGLSAAELCRRLSPFNILVRDCSNFPFLGGSHVRIAVRSRRENERLLETLREVLLG